MTKEHVVPESFCIPPFYHKGSVLPYVVIKEEQTLQSLWDDGYFLFDIIYNMNEKNIYIQRPWEKKDVLVQEVLYLWNNDGKPFLTECYKARNRKKASPMMKKYISIYIQTMFWLTNNYVRSLKNVGAELEKTSFSPLNIKERMEFMLQAPDHHHSFATLTQLFDESRKKWALYLNK